MMNAVTVEAKNTIVPVPNTSSTTVKRARVGRGVHPGQDLGVADRGDVMTVMYRQSLDRPLAVADHVVADAARRRRPARRSAIRRGRRSARVHRGSRSGDQRDNKPCGRCLRPSHAAQAISPARGRPAAGPDPPRQPGDRGGARGGGRRRPRPRRGAFARARGRRPRARAMTFAQRGALLAGLAKASHGRARGADRARGGRTAATRAATRSSTSTAPAATLSHYAELGARLGDADAPRRRRADPGRPHRAAGRPARVGAAAAASRSTSTRSTSRRGARARSWRAPCSPGCR